MPSAIFTTGCPSAPPLMRVCLRRYTCNAKRASPANGLRTPEPGDAAPRWCCFADRSGPWPAGCCPCTAWPQSPPTAAQQVAGSEPERGIGLDDDKKHRSLANESAGQPAGHPERQRGHAWVGPVRAGLGQQDRGVLTGCVLGAWAGAARDSASIYTRPSADLIQIAGALEMPLKGGFPASPLKHLCWAAPGFCFLDPAQQGMPSDRHAPNVPI